MVTGFVGSSGLVVVEDLGAFQNYRPLFEGPHNKDYSILGSMLGSLILGNCHV